MWRSFDLHRVSFDITVGNFRSLDETDVKWLKYISVTEADAAV